MNDELLRIVPPDESPNNYLHLTENITYIFYIDQEDYTLVYLMQDYFIDHCPKSNYLVKLREGLNDSVYIASDSNSTGCPRGIVVNYSVSKSTAFEKALLLFSLKTETHWNLIKIDNVKSKKDANQRNQEHLNSLFDFA